MRKKISPVAFQQQIHKTVIKYNSTMPWPSVPPGDLIAIADALVEYINGVRTTIYLILLRPIDSNKAIIMPFLLNVNSSETLLGWRDSFNQIPYDVRKRIKALVCDGRSAFKTLANENGWLLQRCHFHLLARIAHNRSVRRYTRTNYIGKHIQSLARTIISSKKDEDVVKALKELKKILQNISSRAFRSVISGLIKNYSDYRTYLLYPKYNLPTTSNSAEHVVSLIRDLQYRARGFRSPQSLSLWIEALLKFTKKITCNGKISIPN